MKLVVIFQCLWCPQSIPRASLSTWAGSGEVAGSSRSRPAGLVTGNSRLKPESLGSARDEHGGGRQEKWLLRSRKGDRKERLVGKMPTLSSGLSSTLLDLCSYCDLPDSAFPIPFSRPPSPLHQCIGGKQEGLVGLSTVE